MESELTKLYKSRASNLMAEGRHEEAIAQLSNIREEDVEAQEMYRQCNEVLNKQIEQEKETRKKAREQKKAEKAKKETKSQSTQEYTEKLSDIIGLGSTKIQIERDIITPLKYPKAPEAYGLRATAGILLYGAPGTGKTSIVRAISGEMGIKVVNTKINEVMSPYPGESSNNLVKKFEEAAKNAPCLLFFDEMDLLGSKKDELGREAHTLKEIVNTFITEMDGIQKRAENVFIMGASNQPWLIESSLKRGGRFDTSIYVPLPKYKERVQLFKYYLKGKPLGWINYGRLARITINFSPADIKRICEAATKLAMSQYVKKGAEVIQPIRMPHLLRIMRDKSTGRSSLDEWFADARKLLVGKVKVIQQGKKKQTIAESATLEKDERQIYKELIHDILLQRKRAKANRFIRLFSLYIG